MVAKTGSSPDSIVSSMSDAFTVRPVSSPVWLSVSVAFTLFLVRAMNATVDIRREMATKLVAMCFLLFLVALVCSAMFISLEVLLAFFAFSKYISC